MKKIISLLITDTHLSIDNVDLIIDIFSQAISFCEKNKIRKIIHLGDWFNNRQGQPDYLLAIKKLMIEMMNDSDIVINTIGGNHDKTNLDSFLSYLTVFDSDGFRVHDGERRKYRELHKGATDVYLHFLPYFKPEKYLEQFEIVKKDVVKGKKNVLFTHIGVNGVRNNDGSLVEGNITQDMFKIFDKVFVGHYHDSSKLGKNIYYLGSAYQANFGERMDDKGFHILHDDLSTEFVPAKFPRYFKVSLDAGDKDNIKNSVELYSTKKYQNDFIRFVFGGKQTDIDNVKSNLSMFSNAGIEVKFESDDQNDAINSVANDEFIEFNPKTIKKEFLQYCIGNKISSDKRNWMFKILNEKL